MIGVGWPRSLRYRAGRSPSSAHFYLLPARRVFREILLHQLSFYITETYSFTGACHCCAQSLWMINLGFWIRPSTQDASSAMTHCLLASFDLSKSMPRAETEPFSNFDAPWNREESLHVLGGVMAPPVTFDETKEFQQIIGAKR